MIHGFLDSAAFLPALVVALLVATLVGHRLGRRVESSGLLHVVELAILLVVGAFLMVTYHEVYTGYVVRVAYSHDEADALGGAYRFSTLLPPDDRAWLRSQLLAYVDAKLRLWGGTGSRTEVFKVHNLMWEHMTALSQAGKSPEAVRLCLDALNKAIVLHYRRLYLNQERLPALVLVTMIVGCGLACLAAGHSLAGASRRSAVAMGLLLIVLLTLTVAMIRDLEDPVHAGIQLDYGNLRNLRNGMVQDPT